MNTGLSGLVRQPLWRRWTLVSLLGRLPLTMTLLALVLVGERVAGSLAVGAQLAGVATIAAGIAAPLRGRQLDSGGLRLGLRNAALLTAAVHGAQAAAVVAGAPLGVLFGLAAAQGVSSAALSGGYRALLVSVVSASQLPQANTLEAVLIEIAFVAGPSLAGILALGGTGGCSAGVGPAGPLGRNRPEHHRSAAGRRWRAGAARGCRGRSDRGRRCDHRCGFAPTEIGRRPSCAHSRAMSLSRADRQWAPPGGSRAGAARRPLRERSRQPGERSRARAAAQRPRRTAAVPT